MTTLLQAVHQSEKLGYDTSLHLAMSLLEVECVWYHTHMLHCHIYVHVHVLLITHVYTTFLTVYLNIIYVQGIVHMH